MMRSSYSSPRQGRRHLSSIADGDIPPLPFSRDSAHTRNPRHMCSTTNLPAHNDDDTSHSAVSYTSSIGTTDSPVCVTSTRSSGDLANENKGKSRVVFKQQVNRPLKSPVKTHVILLPWSDARGNEAHYTGQVNQLIQPHGLGCLRYPDGSVLTCEWSNGSSVGLASFPYQANKVEPAEPRKSGLRLGDVACAQDMHVEYDPRRAHEAAAALGVHSFAFLRRS